MLRDVVKDKREAVFWFEKAAGGGNLDAQISLGYAFFSGQGVARDLSKALKWYRSAAWDGHERGMFNLA